MTSATIGIGVGTIGDSAFYQCELLADVYYSGNEVEFADIVVADGNNCFLNAVIHYNSIYSIVAELNTIDYDNGTLSINVDIAYAKKDCEAILTLYKNGIMTICCQIHITPGERQKAVELVAKKLNGEYDVKLFFFDKVSNIKPVGIPATGKLDVEA